MDDLILPFHFLGGDWYTVVPLLMATLNRGHPL